MERMHGTAYGADRDGSLVSPLPHLCGSLSSRSCSICFPSTWGSEKGAYNPALLPFSAHCNLGISVSSIQIGPQNNTG